MILLPLAPIGAEEVKPIVVEHGVPTSNSTPSAGTSQPYSGGVAGKPLTVPSSSYADVMERVKAGERVTFTAPLRGFPGSPGTYDCWLTAGGPMMERRTEVVVQRPFEPNQPGSSFQATTGQATTVQTVGTTATPRPTGSAVTVQNATPTNMIVHSVARRGLLQLGGTGTSSYQCYSYG